MSILSTVSVSSTARGSTNRSPIRNSRGLEQERARRDAIRTNCDQVIARLRDALIPELLERPITGGFLRQARVTAKPRDGESLREALLRTRSEIKQAKGELVTAQRRRRAAADLRRFDVCWPGLSKDERARRRDRAQNLAA